MGSFAGPAGTVAGAKVGGWAGGLLANFPLFYGENLQAQQEEQAERKVEEPLNHAKAAGVGVIQAGIDFFAERLLVGAVAKTGIAKLLRSKGIEPTRGKVNQVIDDTRGSLRKAADRMGKGFGIGATEEALSEVSQQFLTRLQAGQSLTDKQAQIEFIEALAAGGLIGGVAKSSLDAVMGEQPEGEPIEPPTPEQQPPTEEPPPATEPPTETAVGMRPEPDFTMVDEPAVEGELVGPDEGPQDPRLPAAPTGFTVRDEMLNQDLADGTRRRLNSRTLEPGQTVHLQIEGRDAGVARVGERTERGIMYVDEEGNVVATQDFGQPRRTDPVPATVIEDDIPVDKEQEKADRERELYMGEVDQAIERVEGEPGDEYANKDLTRLRGNKSFYEVEPEQRERILATLRQSDELIEQRRQAERDQQAFQREAVAATKKAEKDLADEAALGELQRLQKRELYQALEGEPRERFDDALKLSTAAAAERTQARDSYLVEIDAAVAAAERAPASAEVKQRLSDLRLNELYQDIQPVQRKPLDDAIRKSEQAAKQTQQDETRQRAYEHDVAEAIIQAEQDPTDEKALEELRRLRETSFERMERDRRRQLDDAIAASEAAIETKNQATATYLEDIDAAVEQAQQAPASAELGQRLAELRRNELYQDLQPGQRKRLDDAIRQFDKDTRDATEAQAKRDQYLERMEETIAKSKKDLTDEYVNRDLRRLRTAETYQEIDEDQRARLDDALRRSDEAIEAKRTAGTAEEPTLEPEQPEPKKPTLGQLETRGKAVIDKDPCRRVQGQKGSDRRPTRRGPRCGRCATPRRYP